MITDYTFVKQKNKAHQAILFQRDFTAIRQFPQFL